MIKFYYKTLREQRLSELADFRVGSWIYVENPNEDELTSLAKQFSLDRNILGDALDPNEIPRLEYADGTTYVFTRAPLREQSALNTLPLLIVVGNNFVMTVSNKSFPFLQRFFNGSADFYTTQKSKLFTQIISELNLAYQTFLRDISREVRGMAARFERIENRDIIRLVSFERILNDFLGALIPTNRNLETILKGKHFKLYEEDHELTEDVFLANSQLIESCKSNLKTIVNFREAYSTIITNNLNRVIKILTSLTVVLAVPTMIASFYGMNLPLPFADSPVAFLWILTASLTASIFILGTFVFKRWL